MKSNTKTLTVLAMLAALSIVLVYAVRFPFFPVAAPHLEYDPADMPVVLGAFLFGPGWGLLLTLLVSALQAMTVSASSGVIGFAMHVLATGAYVLAAGFLYRRKTTRAGMAASLAIGTLAAALVMIPLNLIFTPLFGVPLDAVKAMLLPVVIPFNLLKFGLNSVLAFMLYAVLQRFIQYRA